LSGFPLRQAWEPAQAGIAEMEGLVKRALTLVLALGVSAFVAIVVGAAAPSGSARGISYASLNPVQKAHVSGALAAALGSRGVAAKAVLAPGCSSIDPGEEGDEGDDACPPANFAPAGGGGGAATSYQPSGQDACAESRGDNVKVNQNCLNVSDPDLAGRGQAQNETAVAIDPNNKNHVIASQNDYRRGDGGCYGAYSLDGGRHWSDTTIPVGFTRGTAFGGAARQYWQGGGDTSVAWDTKGNAYLSCQAFDRGAGVSPNPDQSSAFYVFRSTGNNGASWNFPGRPVAELNDTAGTGCCLLDKQYMTVDNHVGSPFQDRVYVTWTLYDSDGTAYVYEAHSSDYAEHFSAPVLVSSDIPSCVYTYPIFGAATTHGNCNQNSFSQPFTGPDGNLYVVWANYNTATADPSSPGDNHYQMLLAKSVDGGQTFGTPVVVSDFYELPDCLTYQGSDPGRACVPEKGPSTNSAFRAANYPSGAVNPKDPSQVVVTLASYISKDSMEPGCTPAGWNPATLQARYDGVKTGTCNNDILVSVSNDGGATFTGTTADPRTEQTANPDPAQATTDQYFHWEAFDRNGNLGVDYYDRQYGRPTGSPAVPFDEWTGYSDMTIAGSKGGDYSRWGAKRVTSSSMPPPTQFPDAQGRGQFYGDYIGMDAYDAAIPIWSDTRDPELFVCPGGGAPQVCTGTYAHPTGDVVANDEEIYAASVPIPAK
jgi:hypothetical protein